ncbi:glycosyltransferase [Verrucomicrobiota bacterium]
MWTNTIIHIPSDKTAMDELSFIADLIGILNNCRHSVLLKTFNKDYDFDAVSILQSIGADVLFFEDNSELKKLTATKAILYNTNNVKLNIPSIYYSYGNYDSKHNCSITISASKYNSEKWKLSDKVLIIPPAVNTRAINKFVKRDTPFTVGLVSEGRNKYPEELVKELIRDVPKEVILTLSFPPRYNRPDVLSELRKRKNVITYPVKFMAGLYHVSHCDAVIYGTSNAYNPVYSRTVIEAMAFGKPVICEDRGCFRQLFKHEENILFYKSVDDIIKYINRLKHDKQFYNKIAKAGQLRASWEDISVYAEALRQLVRETYIDKKSNSYC